jgi:hypothetical protein
VRTYELTREMIEFHRAGSRYPGLPRAADQPPGHRQRRHASTTLSPDARAGRAAVVAVACAR